VSAVSSKFTRRGLIIGGAMSLFSVPALAAPARTPVPGGGSVILPSQYKPVLAGDYRYTERDLVIAHRRYHSTMAGTNESDGAIAVALPSKFKNLEDFVRHGRGALTLRWNYANESEGRWYGKPETFAETDGEGPNGPERTGPLSVHTVGWTVYDDPAKLYAVNDRRGLMIAVWILDKHGGEKRARKFADSIAKSFQA
jgi:hypothetical protein